MSPVCFSVSFFSFFSSSVPFSRWPSRESSWSLELHIEAEFAETLLSGSLGLCLTMHNWALLLAYSHDCTLFFFFMRWPRMQPSPPALQPAFPGGPQSHGHKVFQTFLSEGAGLPRHTLNGTRMARTTACLCIHTHPREERFGPCFGAHGVCEAPPLMTQEFYSWRMGGLMQKSWHKKTHLNGSDFVQQGGSVLFKNNQRKKQAACFPCRTQDNQ